MNGHNVKNGILLNKFVKVVGSFPYVVTFHSPLSSWNQRILCEMFHRVVFSSEDFLKGVIGLQILYGKGEHLGVFSSFYSNLFFALYTLFCTSFIQRLKADQTQLLFFFSMFFFWCHSIYTCAQQKSVLTLENCRKKLESNRNVGCEAPNVPFSLLSGGVAASVFSYVISHL